jgi:hypothetical protein
MATNEIVNPDTTTTEDVVTLPRSVVENTTLVVKPKRVNVVKEKKPRSEAQLAATARMREALALRREKGKSEYGATVHSDEYKKSVIEAEDTASRITLETGIKTVVKKPAGRPRGSRLVKEAPTPYVASDNEEEEEAAEEYIPPLVKKAINEIIKQQKAPPVKKKTVAAATPPVRQLSYLERLNMHLI